MLKGENKIADENQKTKSNGLIEEMDLILVKNSSLRVCEYNDEYNFEFGLRN